MNKPHKHAEFIKAWADGAVIQFRPVPGHGEWVDEPKHLLWDDHAEYRIKPEPKPDFVKYVDVHSSADTYLVYEFQNKSTNLRLIFDGETKVLKSAEVIK